MAVVSVMAKWSGLNCTKEKLGAAAAFRSTAQKGFTVVFDTISDLNQIAATNAVDPVTAVAVPATGADFGDISGTLRLRRKQAQPLKRHPRVYEVACEYAGEDSPLSQAPVKAWDDEVSEEATDDDADGNAVTNPLGDPIIGWTRDFYDGVYSFSRNEATSTIIQPNAWRGSTNDGEITLAGFACTIGTLLMKKMSGTKVTEGDWYYWKTNYLIKYRADGWLKRVLCQGNYYWDGTTKSGGAKRVVPCLADDGVTPRTRPLTATGLLLPEGDPQVWILKPKYASVSWTSLGLS